VSTILKHHNSEEKIINNIKNALDTYQRSTYTSKKFSHDGVTVVTDMHQHVEK